MAIIKVHLEAVRYLAAKAVYGGNEKAKAIMGYSTYRRRGSGFSNLLEFPFYRDGNSPRAVNVIADLIAEAVGADWYKLLLTDDGISSIHGVLLGGNSSFDISSSNVADIDDKTMLNFFRQQEALFDSRN